MAHSAGSAEPGRLALVTGATAGIGAAFARALAADGYALVLVARDGDRLAALAEELTGRYGTAVDALPADLATDEGCRRVADRLTDPARPVDLLVNNAGFGLDRSVVRSTLADEERLLAVNVRAVLRLTHAALAPMAARGRGDIVNVSSVAGFAGAISGSAYPASKAWVTTFSESVAVTVRSRGVRVMALCPGYTRTEFHDRAGIDTSRMPGWLWLDADAVVRSGLRDLRRGRVVSVPDWRYRTMVLVLRHTPRRLLASIARGAAGRIGRE